MDLTREVQKGDQSTQDTPRAVVVIGTNTGGPGALAQILPSIQQNLPASIIVVQQMRLGFTALLAEHLSAVSDIRVSQAQDNQPLKSNEVVLVPGALVHRSLNMRPWTVEPSIWSLRA